MTTEAPKALIYRSIYEGFFMRRNIDGFFLKKKLLSLSLWNGSATLWL